MSLQGNPNHFEPSTPKNKIVRKEHFAFVNVTVKDDQRMGAGYLVTD